MSIRRSIRVASVLAVLALAGVIPGSSPAAGAEAEKNAAARVLTSPPRILASVAPGGTTTATLLVANQSRASASLVLRVSDLAPDPESDSFGVLVDVGDAPRGAGEWLSIQSTTLALGPGEQRTVPITIRVPADADAGGHYGAVVVETAAGGDGAADEPVRVRVRLVTHVNVLVPGEVRYDARFTDVRARRSGSGRMHVRASFENTGNIQTAPRDVRLRVTGPTGSHTVELDIPETMPGGARALRRSVEIPSPAGRFTSRFSMELEDGRTIRSRSVDAVAWRAWVPAAIVAAPAVVAALLLFILIRRRLEFRRMVQLELERMADEEPARRDGTGSD